MFYLTTHSIHCLFMVICHQTYAKGPPKMEETCCCHIGCSFQLATRVLLCASFQTGYHDLCYTSRGGQDGKRNSSMGP